MSGTARRPSSRGRRACLAAIFAVGLATVVATPAGAHVSTDPENVTTGEIARVSFRVPNESATADTTQIKMQLPQDTPLAFVRVRPPAGWTFTTESTPLPAPVKTDYGVMTSSVSVVTFIGGAIKPGGFEVFELLAGPFPDESGLVFFPTIQTYSDGKLSNWIQKFKEGDPEPDNPAPVLKVVSSEENESASTNDDSDAVPTIALIVGIVALLGAAGALAIVRRRLPSPTRDGASAAV